MGMIDYGAVVIKNGEVINHSTFMNMDEAVGWNDLGRLYWGPAYGKWYQYSYLYENCFAYIGDKDFTLGFYKTECRVSWEDNYELIYADSNSKSHTFICNGVSFKIKEICERVYLCSLDYKGDHYKVVFGYGIDCDRNTWNKIKNRYLGKRRARKVDNVYKRWINE